MSPSLFSYSITRPYPFQWFSYVVIIGGLFFTAIFSFVNVATNGYQMTTIYTANPNASLDATQWYQQAPWSWSNSINVNCQAQDLTVGTDLITTNLGLSYTVQNAFTPQYQNGTRKHLPAIPYLNNTLQDCEVTQIRIRLMRGDACSGPHCPWLTWSKSTATASSSCTVAADELYMLNITTVYDSYPNEFGAFVDLDASSQGSIWWGAFLLSMWFEGLRAQMAVSEPVNGTYAWGDITLTFNQSKNIDDMDFINYIGSFGLDNGETLWPSPNSTAWTVNPLSAWNQTSNHITPYIAQQLDGFTKALYSTILVDLGQGNGPNVLTNPDALQYYLAASSDVNRNTDAVGSYEIPAAWHPGPVPASEAYKTLNTSTSGMGPLGAKAARIFSQYTCQVPQIKSAGQLLIAIVIGDLVLLQALWKGFTFATGLWLNRVDSKAMMCEGCLQAKYNGPYELVRASTVMSTMDSTRHLRGEDAPVGWGDSDEAAAHST